MNRATTSLCIDKVRKKENKFNIPPIMLLKKF